MGYETLCSFLCTSFFVLFYGYYHKTTTYTNSSIKIKGFCKYIVFILYVITAIFLFITLDITFNNLR
jgi:hypothetical protein